MKRDSGRCADHADPVAQIARLEVVLLLTLREHPDAALNIFAACGDRNIVSAGYGIVAVKQRLGLLRHIRHQSHRHALIQGVSFLEAGAEQSFQRCVEDAARLVLQIVLDELSDIDVVVGPLLGFGEQFLEEGCHHRLFVRAVVGEDLAKRLVKIRDVAGDPGEAAGCILDGSLLELIGVVLDDSGELFEDLAGHFEPLVVDPSDSAGHIVIVADLVVADVIAQQQVAAEDLHLRAEILIPCDDEFLAFSFIGARAFLLHHIIDLRRTGVRCHLRLAAALDRSALFFRDQVIQCIDACGCSRYEHVVGPDRASPDIPEFLLQSLSESRLEAFHVGEEFAHGVILRVAEIEMVVEIQPVLAEEIRCPVISCVEHVVDDLSHELQHHGIHVELQVIKQVERIVL